MLNNVFNIWSLIIVTSFSFQFRGERQYKYLDKGHLQVSSVVEIGSFGDYDHLKIWKQMKSL